MVQTSVQIPVWVKDIAERAARTWIAAFLGMAGWTGAETKFGQIHWIDAAQAATLTTIFTLLIGFSATAVAAKTAVGTTGTASLINLDAYRKASAVKAVKKTNTRTPRKRVG